MNNHAGGDYCLPWHPLNRLSDIRTRLISAVHVAENTGMEVYKTCSVNMHHSSIWIQRTGWVALVHRFSHGFANGNKLDLTLFFLAVSLTSQAELARVWLRCGRAGTYRPFSTVVARSRPNMCLIPEVVVANVPSSVYDWYLKRYQLS